MPAAVEQQHVEFFLQLAHGVGDGGGHAIEFDRGARETAAAVDCIEHGQRFEGE